MTGANNMHTTRCVACEASMRTQKTNRKPVCNDCYRIYLSLRMVFPHLPALKKGTIPRSTLPSHRFQKNMRERIG
jgi:hypothetical protein